MEIFHRLIIRATMAELGVDEFKMEKSTVWLKLHMKFNIN